MPKRKPEIEVAFRASSTGKCIRQIVLQVLEPGYGKPTLEWELFLRRGHTDQVAVLSYLRQFGGLDILTEEEEKVKLFEDVYTLSGHTDAIVIEPSSSAHRIADIKAVLSKNYLKIANDPSSWTKHYPQYLGQLTAYLDLWPKCKSAALIFEDRDTADLIGGLKLVQDLPHYTYNPALNIFRDPYRTRALRLKLFVAAGYIHTGEVPSCDGGSFCWFCSGKRGGVQTKKGGREWKKSEIQDMIQRAQETVQGIEKE